MPETDCPSAGGLPIDIVQVIQIVRDTVQVQYHRGRRQESCAKTMLVSDLPRASPIFVRVILYEVLSKYDITEAGVR